MKFQTSSFKFDELSIDPHNIAPMLGYEDALPDDILVIVKEVMDETAECFDICGGYQIFDNITFLQDEYCIRLAETDFVINKTVYQQLKNSNRMAVFVCTAGDDIRHWSKQIMPVDPLKGLIADLLGSVVVEAAIETIHKKLGDEMAQAGLKITNRYSPGYCGWRTEEQHKLFGLLPENICGIRLTESALMLPVKSVSGFIGIGENVRFNPYTCRICDASFCVYRKKNKRIV